MQRELLRDEEAVEVEQLVAQRGDRHEQGAELEAAQRQTLGARRGGGHDGGRGREMRVTE
ncbi:hypothetical protein rosag_23500 [Roseisolibacter agri]|uniref:Uncharacterized protein n=1 Tax=Roseisolibacter agri TaxID=2014610 RepID=A0AA37Q6Y9_9BACT|nr:hypothetical protein rosag_23500 [Roseisolibacter agri]